MSKGAKKTFLTRLADTRTTDDEGVGTLRWEGNKCYKWVKYNAGSTPVTCVADEFAYYYAAAGDAASLGYESSEVTQYLTDALMAAGVAQAIIADGSYGWIQIKGPATVNTAMKAGADGQMMTRVGASTDGSLDVSAAVTDSQAGCATDISADMIALDCPF